MDNERLIYLFDRYIRGELAPAEELEFFTLAQERGNEAELQGLIHELWERIPGSVMTGASEEGILQAIFAVTPAKIISVRKNYWKRIAIAASVIFLLGFATYFLFFNRAGSPLTTHDSRLASQDVAAPSTNHATITLADGKKIFLDSTSNGQLATQNNVSIIKTEDGKINYQLTANSQQLTAQYNTLTNPRGSKVIDMTLADGSRVWLNAGSSITYPVAFMNNERKVSITGEAYFEVKHNDKMPFRVTNTSLPSGGSGWAVDDIGTSFNINAYDDEDAIRVTLLDGSVKVSRLTSPDSRLLTPGQQAVLTPGSGLTTQSYADLDRVMAWKNGIFDFSQQEISVIMKEISRWYDVEIVYEGQKPDDLFSGIVKRDNNVSQVLNKLAQTERVHFRIEDKKVIVTK